MTFKQCRLAILISALAAPWTICIPTAQAQQPAADTPQVRGVDRAPVQPDERLPKRIAICIGIDGYSTQGYPPLRCAVSDAEALAKAFAALGYETHLLTDRVADASLRPTYENLSRELRHVIFSATQEEDTLVITFSGHGDAIGGMPVLLPLDYGTEHAPLSVNHLLDAELLGNPLCRARKKLLILDACHSAGGGLAQLMQEMRVESCVLFSGCGQRQLSVEDEKLGHGHLTQAILDGLAGKGYGKDEKFLLVEDIEKYIRRRFEEENWSPMQIPEFRGRTTGKFDLAVRELPKLPQLSNYDRKMLARALEDARAAWKEKHYTDAVDAATHALRIDEKNADALAERALAYLSMGYRNQALADAAQACALDPNQLLATQVRGVASIVMDDDPAARREGLALLQTVTAAVDADPGHWPSLAAGELAAVRWGKLGYGHAVIDRDYPAATAACTRVIEMKDAPAAQWVLALVNRAFVYETQGLLEKAVADCTRVIEMTDAPANEVAAALINRGFAYEKQGYPEKAVADCTCVIEMKNASAEQVAQALFNRGVAYRNQGQVEKELADYSRVIAMKDASAEEVADALLNRGLAYRAQGHSEQEMADYNRVIEMKDAPVEQRAKALVNRAVAYGNQGHLEKEVADCTRVIEMTDAPLEQVAQALIDRGITYGNQGHPEREVADYSRVVDMKDVPAALVAMALVDRGITYGEQSQPKKAAADYTRVIEMKHAPATQLARALLRRGIVYADSGRQEKAVADYTQVIGMKDAPVEQVAVALIDRGIAYGKQGHWEKEVAEYTRVIDLKDAPAGDVARALLYRGITFGEQDQPDKEAADYTRIIEINDVPAHYLTSALVRRGRANYKLGRLDAALRDSQRAVERDPRNRAAVYNVGLILLRDGRPVEARAAYEAATAQGALDGAIDDLIQLRDKLHGPPETAVFLGLLRIRSGKEQQGRDDLQSYVKDHPHGPMSDWARQLLAAPATRPANP